MNGRKVFWLHTYHPSNWGKFNKQRHFWGKYSSMIYEFIEEVR